MKKTMKLITLVVAFIMALCFMSGCGQTSEEEPTGSSNGITIFNSKMEIQDQMLEMAKRYTEETGVPVEVYYSSDTVSAHLATRYASGNPYTLSMVDAKDIYSLAEDHAVDMSDQEWTKDTQYAIGVGDKIYGFPVCIEARARSVSRREASSTTRMPSRRSQAKSSNRRTTRHAKPSRG